MKDPLWLHLAAWSLGALAIALAVFVLAHGAVGCGLDFIGAVKW